ncbi:hypothetical protein VTO73DRAFT_8055 [Trametes versicolor]
MTSDESLIIESIEVLLSQVKEQTHRLSSKKALLYLKHTLAETMADINEVLNTQCPLLSIPTELLQDIMALIPDSVQKAVEDTDHRRLENRTAANAPLPTPSSLQGCRHLRRVTLAKLDGHLAAFVLSLLVKSPVLAVQLHNVWSLTWAPSRYPLLSEFKFSKVVIGRYPQPASHGMFSPSFVWGFTLSGAERTLRRIDPTLEVATDTLSHRQEGTDAALADVRELWIGDTSPAPCDELHVLTSPEADHLRALVRRMPALECVVLVNQLQAPWTGLPPSLRLLPDAREGDGHVGPRPSTVRIAHGYGKHVLNRWRERPDPTPAVPPLDLTHVFEELVSGAYEYARHLVIEVPYHVVVDAGDVERLREYCDTVQVKVVNKTPTVALAIGASDDPWPYSLW